MINQDQTIPCPTCQTKISFDTMQLLMGMQFVCHNCHSAIGLAAESKPVVEQTIKKFEEIKRKAA
jgi:transcription initiation factor IIE alpha subunit